MAWRVLRLRCPACGIGRPYSGLTGMRPHCRHCGFRFEREPGYFLGAIYVNYGVTAGASLAAYFAIERLFDLDPEQQIVAWLPFLVLFPFWFFRYARLVWSAADLLVDPPRPDEFATPATPQTGAGPDSRGNGAARR